MDAYPYAFAAPPYHQFMGLPPTPHTSTNSEDYSNSPPVRDHLFHPNPNTQSQHPHSYTQSLLTPKQDAVDFQPNFDAFNQYNGVMPQKPPSPTSQHKASVSSVPNGFDVGSELPDGNDRRGGSNSDDEDNMTPAQSRRKAQNRAAQRAFRERKERHVKDLEAKLAELQNKSATVAEENARLKSHLQKAATENEILKATSAHGGHGGASQPLPNAGPLKYSPTDFYSNVLYAHENKTPSHRIVLSDAGERLFAAGATWDYIIQHPLYLEGRVDVGSVSEKLKTVAKCDGQGPVFEESAIIDAIEKSVASGSDELL